MCSSEKGNEDLLKDLGEIHSTLSVENVGAVKKRLKMSLDAIPRSLPTEDSIARNVISQLIQFATQHNFILTSDQSVLLRKPVTKYSK